ncbi:hypothetical protein VTH06DRAFT_4480 [Thermothelomyces fergusii]
MANDDQNLAKRRVGIHHGIVGSRLAAPRPLPAPLTMESLNPLCPKAREHHFGYGTFPAPTPTPSRSDLRQLGRSLVIIRCTAFPEHQRAWAKEFDIERYGDVWVAMMVKNRTPGFTNGNGIDDISTAWHVLPFLTCSERHD